MRDEKVINEALGENPATHSESTLRRIASNCEPLVKQLLFSEELKLETPISGGASFQSAFLGSAKVDSKGRSFRDFDLKTRLFKYPCSYLIDSAAMNALPEPAKEYVNRRLVEVLSGSDTSKPFAHLSAADRTAISEMLVELKPDFRAAWEARKR